MFNYNVAELERQPLGIQIHGGNSKIYQSIQSKLFIPYPRKPFEFKRFGHHFHFLFIFVASHQNALLPIFAIFLINQIFTLLF